MQGDYLKELWMVCGKAGEKYGVGGNLILCGMRHMPAEKNVELVETARKYLGRRRCC